MYETTLTITGRTRVEETKNGYRIAYFGGTLYVPKTVVESLPSEMSSITFGVELSPGQYGAQVSIKAVLSVE